MTCSALRRIVRRSMIGIALALTIAACGGASALAGGPAANIPCPPPDVEIRGAVDIDAQCRRLLAAADARLGVLHWPVSRVSVRWTICPPNARCAMVVQFGQAWVIYEFVAGDPVMIHVGPRFVEDVVVEELFANAPEPLPDWLLAELEEEAAS
jgi:hypothetical protein